jgi:hypothetical protein
MAADTTERAEDGEPGGLRSVVDTVTPPYVSRPDTEMNALGWSLFVGILILLVPFLPLILAVWAISKLLDALSGE